MGVLSILDFVAPEFSGETTATKETAVDLATQELSSSAWGTLYPRAVALLAAHILKVRERTQGAAASQGIVGSLTSVKTGDLSVTGAGKAGQGWESTEYGQALQGLEDRIPTSPFISD